MLPIAVLNQVLQAEGEKTGYVLLGEKDGQVNGCRCGVSIYIREEYDLENAGAHDDQEGFFVLEGNGSALVGNEKITMEPSVAFGVPKGVRHAMKKDKKSEACKVLWFHSAAECDVST